MASREVSERIAKMREQMAKTKAASTPEELAQAQADMDKLEEMGFFHLCGCSREETNLPTDGQTKD